MSIRKKFIIIFSIILLSILSIGAFTGFNIGRVADYLRGDVPQTIQQISDSSYLDSIAQLIRYDDEVLTQSARNYAFTGDIRWKNRYEEYVPKLDQRIEEAQEKGDAEDKKIFASIDQANIVLVELETEALEMVDQGKLLEAQKILDGEEYFEQKKIYKEGVDKYLSKRGAQSDQAMSVSTELLNKTNSQIKNLTVMEGWLTGIFITLIIILMIALYLMVYFSVIIPLGQFKKAAKAIANGNLNQKITIKGHDEVADLAETFNQMAVELKDSKENIETKIKERTEELEKLNRFMTGRELKMIELKDKIRDLEENAQK